MITYPKAITYQPGTTTLREAAAMYGYSLRRLEPFSSGKYEVRVTNAPAFRAFPHEIWDYLRIEHGLPCTPMNNHADRAWCRDLVAGQ